MEGKKEMIYDLSFTRSRTFLHRICGTAVISQFDIIFSQTIVGAFADSAHKRETYRRVCPLVYTRGITRCEHFAFIQRI